MKISLSFEKFKELSSNYNLIPIYEEIFADMETPVSAFLKINKGKYGFLLESVVGGEMIARYSFLGADPSTIFIAKENKIKIIQDYKYLKEETSEDPIDSLRKLVERYTPYNDPRLPRFYGGAVGYFSYDSIRYIEKIPDANPDKLDIPDIMFVFTDSIIIFDHLEKKAKIVNNIHIDKKTLDDDYLKEKYDKALMNINYIRSLLDKPVEKPKNNISLDKEFDLNCNFKETEYKQAVEKAKEYIKAGDTFQVQISRRFEIDIEGLNTFNFYRSLRTINPSPYMFYYKFDDLEIVGASPELLVREENRKVTVRPIAGTRRRGKDADDEKRMEEELRNDEKEQAEHVMLIDLGRNDIGRVCKYGTVKVDDFMVIEKYSHVMHIVSSVVGELSDDKDQFDLFKSTFPAGTLTGAPKIRSMEIIDELENVKRGLYGGFIGYFSFSGNMDSCIAIRTAVIKNQKMYLQAAAGIVADSKPDLEYIETENKLKALIKALEISKEF